MTDGLRQTDCKEDIFRILRGKIRDVISDITVILKRGSTGKLIFLNL